VVEDAATSAITERLGDFERDTLNLNALGENQSKAQEIFNEVGFP
jgi:iron(III) transport system substrate-binding protein